MIKRLAIYGVVILLVVGAVGGYMLYQNRQANIEAGEAMKRHADQIDRMRQGN